MAAIGNDGEVHEKIREDLANNRASAPTANKSDIIARNKAALEKRKQAQAAAKAAENAKELPEGWKRVESRSRPGDFVYENIHTEERQSWFPDAPAKEEVGTNLAPMSAAESAREALKKKNAAALQKRKQEALAKKDTESKLELPSGWIRSESKSRPGELVYENTVTGERQAWFPDEPATQDPKADIKAKNAAALEKRKAALAAKKSEDAGKALPAGWKRVESRSRPGEFVYENEFTEERQAWFPETPAAKPLPEGWRKVESRTYPGEFVYENIHTLERQAWEPTEGAPLVENQVAMPTSDQLKKAESAPANVIGKAKALYDYTASNREEEIDMIEGDIIQIEYKADNGWWVGVNTRTNRNGIFPGTYVEDL
eukprot:m.181861 g.181861  ORF g.181861 m.181861 type:complete len:372 (-) comp32083_c0_seq1:331-1446(-)